MSIDIILFTGSFSRFETHKNLSNPRALHTLGGMMNRVEVIDLVSIGVSYVVYRNRVYMAEWYTRFIENS